MKGPANDREESQCISTQTLNTVNTGEEGAKAWCEECISSPASAIGTEISRALMRSWCASRCLGCEIFVVLMNL